ncbi:MAG: hypothetical protein V1702_00575 [Candidatus Woesearchaeota archaeon]
MVVVSKESLEKAVFSSIKELHAKGRTNYRCHELSRALCQLLHKYGFEAVVKEGTLEYNVGFLLSFMSEFSEILRRDFRDSELTSSIPVYSSWCEVEGFRIAGHYSFDLPHGTKVQNLLLIRTEAELEGKVKFHYTRSKQFSVLGKECLLIQASRRVLIPFCIVNLRTEIYRNL